MDKNSFITKNWFNLVPILNLNTSEIKMLSFNIVILLELYSPCKEYATFDQTSYFHWLLFSLLFELLFGKRKKKNMQMAPQYLCKQAESTH